MMAHNGHSLVVNTDFSNYWSGDFPFRNLAQSMTNWVCDDGATPTDLTKHLSNGDPSEIYDNSGTPAMRRFGWMPTQDERSGDYVLRWSGTKTLAIGLLSYSLVSGSLSGTDGRAVIRPTNSSQYQFQIKATATDGTEFGLIFCHENDETDLVTNGEIFSVAFLAMFAAAGDIRSLNLIDPYAFARWDHRNTLENCTWVHGRYRPDLYAGTTTNSGDDFSATLSGFTFTDGAMVQLTMNTDPGSNTIRFNINGTGLKNLYSIRGTAITATAGRPNADAGTIVTLIANTTLDGYIIVGGFDDYPQVPKGWPPELVVKLCAKVGANPWFCVPMLACDDPDQTWVTGAATYIAANHASMRAKYEPSNELWHNGAPAFHAWYYILAIEAARGYAGAGEADIREWRGRAMSRMGQAAFAVHGDASAYAVMCAVQSGGATSAVTDSLASARYIAEPGKTSADAAANWVSAGAIANYPVTSLSGQDFTDAADAWAAADAAGKTTLINAFVRGGTWATHKTRITDFGAVFEAAGLEFYQYECSWQSGDWADGTTNEQAFKEASVYAPDLVYLYMDLWRHFREAGGVGPAVFCTSGTTQWAVRPGNAYNPTPTTMWEVMEFERLKTRRMRLLLS